MVLTCRSYTDADLPAVQAALADWRRTAGLPGCCHVGDLPHRVYAELRGRRPVGELVRVWSDDVGIAGVAVCGRFDTSFDVFVRPALRGGDEELDMLRVAYDVTRRLMVATDQANTWVNSDVFADDLVRAEQLRRLGFARYRVWDHVLTRPLDGVLPSAVLPEGFTVGPAPTDVERLAAIRNESFDEGWTGAELRAVVLEKPGYADARELVVTAPDGRLAAYTITWIDSANGVGHFEPVGTSGHFRRRGLARALLCQGLAELRAAGMRTATVAHAADNVAAGALYRDVGFVRAHETHGYRRVE